MAPGDKVQPITQRTETDASLRQEREKTDEQLSKRASVIEKEADQVVEVARQRADGLLEVARDKADATLRKTGGPAEVMDRLSVTRASEDEELTEERAVADLGLENERIEQRRALELLLKLEREDTDARLLTERVHSDDAVATRDDFLAMVSHDVRGILAGMATSADLLIRTPVADTTGDRVHLEAQRIRRLTARMNRLVGDLLDVVSIESGKLNVVAAPEDARRLLAETMEGFHHTAAARRIAMTCNVAQRQVLASFDHDRILQVLSNLVGNAMKFTQEGGTVALSLAPIADGIQFTVRDNGCGIAAEHLDTIFERFSQAAQSDRRGLGLGLYIARSIIDAHGGKIWAESQAGRGSTFHFTLPSTRQA